MKVLVTGNQGYIGSVLVQRLMKQDFFVKGLDIGYYADNLLTKPSNKIDNFEQIKKDIRNIQKEDLLGIDAIIHLAALSNDPLGELDTSLTKEINYLATVRLAKIAKKVGVKRFVFASTQSIYGISDSDIELDEDLSKKNPITAYAHTKWFSELELKKITSQDFVTVCFRPATVFGESPRLRCDIVFNNFVASAYTSGKIQIKSDGTPWRPIVHINDVCDAFIAGLLAPAHIINGRSFNVGIQNGNYTVRQLAKWASKVVKDSKITFTGEHRADSRSYKVSFARILSELSSWYCPKWNLENGGAQLVEFLRSCNFSREDFKGPKTNRILQLNFLLKKKKINSRLSWISNNGN